MGGLKTLVAADMVVKLNSFAHAQDYACMLGYRRTCSELEKRTGMFALTENLEVSDYSKPDAYCFPIIVFL
jgi:hypothetical protein